MESRGIANVNFRSRIRQIIILVLAIFIGVLVSQAVQAQAPAHNKAKYHRQMKSNRVCTILHKKRNHVPRQPVFASNNRKAKYKPMAEVDAPASKPQGVASN